MTEEEAKTKRCCGSSTCGEVRPVDDESRWSGPYPNFCIGSACMAWRWALPSALDAAGNLVPKEKQVVPGYCGLAGQP